MDEKTKYIIGGIIALIIIVGVIYAAYYWQPPAPGPTPTAKQKMFHKQVIYLINNEWATRKQLFTTGTADSVYVPAENIDEVNGTVYQGTDYQINITALYEAAEFGIFFATLNCHRAPFNGTDGLYVRQALAWATPYQSIYDVVYNGLMRPYYGVLPYGMPGWTDYNIMKFNGSLDVAQSLIAKTSLYNQNKTYQIEIMYNLGNQARANVATLLQNSWGRLVNKWGNPIFQISVAAYNWPTVLAKGETGDYDVWLIGWAPDYVDPDNYATPMFYGATSFSSIEVHEVTSASDVANYIKNNENATVIETPNYYVVVGQKGTGFTPTQTGKKYLVVAYEANWTDTPTIEELMAQGLGFSYINPSFYRNVTADALIIAGQAYVYDPQQREAIYNAIHEISNFESPAIWVGQYVPTRVTWTWAGGHYFHPVLPARWDLLYEYSDAPSVDIGIGSYKNNASTWVVSTIGWPRSLDPASSYETFGWLIFYETGSTLVTYWKEETESFTPNLGVAWAYSQDKGELYFVIRGGVVAYDHWNDKTYPIDASDVLFSLWRIARLRHSVSWMINAFIDVNSSTWLTETEFDNYIKSNGVLAVYKGKSKTITGGLDDLLSFFGYSGETAHVLKLKLYVPYPAILSILADPFTKALPAEYVLGENYTAAMQATNNGKNPAGYAQYVGNYWKTDWTHALLHQYPVSTGPYYLKEYEEDSYLVFEYNPYYWNASMWKDLYGFDAETGTYVTSQDVSNSRPLIQMLVVFDLIKELIVA